MKVNSGHFVFSLGALLILTTFRNCTAQEIQIQNGAERLELYMPLLRNENVGMVANQTSVIGSLHLVDVLLDNGIKMVKIFSPEHGFSGSVDAGVAVIGADDIRTGISIYSLYGSKTKPSPDDLKEIDVMIFDLQDVGARFYTYISTLHNVMEACAENGIELIILDRPNPNGHYIDGPLLEKGFESFVGIHPIPVVYGMTIGELAQMINGEGWLQGGIQCDLKIIPCKGYTHGTPYTLPVHPSPNITTMEAVYLYPSLCFFEGTVMNVGRGTDFPFRLFGHPDYPDRSFSYMPSSNSGNADPLHKGQQCSGVDLTGMHADSLFAMGRINLGWIMEAYESMDMGRSFFNGYFNTLAGNSSLMEQIIKGLTEEEIRKTWEPDLNKFRQIRTKYLLYE
ncbi:MAG: DUF1343 domain-containing protein [Bacteroidales bacterium]|nr:DUF1343 domain-containing protein [Bacteroidales bacterium]